LGSEENAVIMDAGHISASTLEKIASPGDKGLSRRWSISRYCEGWLVVLAFLLNAPNL